MLDRAIALVALPWLRDRLGVLAPVCGKRTADIVRFVEAPVVVTADEALVAFVGLYQFAFVWHGDFLF